MVIGGQAVSMCQKDSRLNATQLCNPAGLTTKVRSNLLKILKRRCGITHVNYTRGPKHSWVPFKDGVFLCQVLKLCDIMKPLFLEASLDVPEEEENYLLKHHRTKLKRQSTNVKQQGAKLKLPDGYKTLQCGNKRVVYMPSTRKFHAVQLLRLSGICEPRTKLTRFLSQNRAVLKEVLKGHCQVQGTYIGFDDARLLCQYFCLSENPVNEIVRQETVTEANILGDFDSNLYDRTYDLKTDVLVGLIGNHVNRPEIAATHPIGKYSPTDILNSFLAPESQSSLQLVGDAHQRDSICKTSRG